MSASKITNQFMELTGPIIGRMASVAEPGAKTAIMRMRSAAILMVFALAAGCGAPHGSEQARSQLSADPPPVAAATPLATEICRLLAAPTPLVAKNTSAALPALQAVYAARNCAPLWSEAAALTPTGRQLGDRMHRIGAGIPLERAANQAERELLMSAAFATLAVDPADLTLPPSPSRLAALADQAARDPGQLRLMVPVDPQIRRLRDAIQTYRELERLGGWPLVPDGPKLALGVRDARVETLRQRLQVPGDLPQGVTGDPMLFDATLDAGLRRFQSRHGLEVDGIAAKETLAALNVPVAGRIAGLVASQQTLWSQNRDWGTRYIAVNIAAATLTLVEDGQIAAQRRVIVGRSSWQTPRLDGVIDRLEFHPYWTVPARIAQLELLPKIRRDSDYLRRNSMTMVSGQIRQAPGPGNPLGQVKFLFDNPYSVYLHDTSAPELFDRSERFLSHGCVRVEQAVDLARRLLRDDPAWPPAQIDAALAVVKNIRIDLIRPIPLHVVYDTAWVEDDGTVNFRKDVYGLAPAIAAVGTAGGARSGGNCGA